MFEASCFGPTTHNSWQVRKYKRCVCVCVCVNCPGKTARQSVASESKSMQSKPIKAPPPQCDFHTMLSCEERTEPEPASPTCCRCPGRNSMKTPCESKSVQSKPIKAPPSQCDFHMTLSCGKRTEPASPTCCRCPGRNSMKT